MTKTARQPPISSVDEEEVAQFSRIAGAWWDPNGPFAPLHRMNPVRIGYIRELAMRHFSLPENTDLPFSGLRIADIGCGGGLICEPMARLGGRVSGIDASEENIAVARRHAESSGLTIDYRATTAEAMAQDGEACDLVLALEILEHVADVSVFLEACAALVRPGGLLVLSTLNRTARSFLMAIVGAEYLLRWLPRGTHDWSKFLLPSEIDSVLKPQAMQLCDLTGMCYHPLRGDWSLSKQDTAVNYLMGFWKE